MSIFNKIKGIVKRSNPALVEAGTEVDPMYDRLGRQVTYPYSLRGNVSTSSSTITRNDRTVFLDATAGVFNDLVTVFATNTSTNAVTIDLRSGYDSGVIATLTVEGSKTTQFNFPVVPLPATEASTPWAATASSIAADSGDSPVTLNVIAINNQ